MKLHLITLLAVATLAGCGKETPAPQQATTPPPTEAAATPAPAIATVQTGNADLGSIKYRSSCSGCHGQQGEGTATFPKVAGQSAEALATKLRDYRAGKTLGKQSAMMAPNASHLTDAEIEALAAYMAQLGQG